MPKYYRAFSFSVRQFGRRFGCVCGPRAPEPRWPHPYPFRFNARWGSVALANAERRNCRIRGIVVISSCCCPLSEGYQPQDDDSLLQLRRTALRPRLPRARCEERLRKRQRRSRQRRGERKREIQGAEGRSHKEHLRVRHCWLLAFAESHGKGNAKRLCR